MRQRGNGCGSGVGALDAADDDDLSELALVVSDSGCVVAEQDGHVLECAAVAELFFYDGGGFADGIQSLGCYFADDTSCEAGAGEWDSVCDFLGHVEEFGHLADAIFAECLERLDYGIAVRLFGVDAELGEDVVLAFYSGDGLFDVCKDCAVEQELCS